MTHKGEHCTIYLSDLEKLAHDTAAYILNKPHMSKDDLVSLLHHEFVRAQAMPIPKRIEPLKRSIK